MKYELTYNCSGSYEDVEINLHDYTFYVEESLTDIIDYAFRKKYGKSYKNSTSWYLEEGAKAFVKDIETKWFKNEIDTWALQHDFDFIDYLKEEYLNSALHKFATDNNLIKSWYESIEKEYGDLNE